MYWFDAPLLHGYNFAPYLGPELKLLLFLGKASRGSWNAAPVPNQTQVPCALSRTCHGKWRIGGVNYSCTWKLFGLQGPYLGLSRAAISAYEIWCLVSLDDSCANCYFFLVCGWWSWYILVLTLTQAWTAVLSTVSNKRIGTDLRSEWHRELMSILWSWGYSMVSTWGYVLGLSLPLRVKILSKSYAAGEENGKGTGWVNWTQKGL